MSNSLGSPRSAAHALTVVGVVLVAAFFAPWIDVGGAVKLSGWWLANHGSSKLFLVPLLGAALIAAGIGGWRYLTLFGMVTSIAIVGTTAYYTLRSMFELEIGGLLTLVGGALALAGIGGERRWLRVAGGAVAMAGFFLPWVSDVSAFDIVRTDTPIEQLGLWFAPMWAVPVGALFAVAAGLTDHRGGRALAGIGGAGVLGGLLWFLYSLVNLVAGWGAWVTLGAGVAAGAIALAGARKR